MSTGTRIPLAFAEAATTYLLGRWGMENATVVGSLRRRKLDVGDVEICVPIEPAEHDNLYKMLLANANQQVGLFARSTDSPPLTLVKGVKPGFRQAAVVAHLRSGDRDLKLPIEIFRYAPGCRGWSILMRTGPKDFGQWFLGRWKRYWNIPKERPASIKGGLVDNYGVLVPIDEEMECFRKIGIGYVEPEQRADFVASMRSGQ